MIRRKVFVSSEELGDDGSIHELANIDPDRLQKLRELFGEPDPGKDQLGDVSSSD